MDDLDFPEVYKDKPGTTSMIKVIPPPEPERFHIDVRERGKKLLDQHMGKKLSSKDFKPYWDDYRHQLKRGFSHRCGYSATIVHGKGSVDHYLGKVSYPQQAYEWSNYRFASREMNSLKSTYDEKILDPFEVEDDWFSINLSTFEIVLTDAIPNNSIRERAKFTLEKLELNSQEAIESRLFAASMAFRNPFNEEVLETIRVDHPLIARALEEFRHSLRSSLSKDRVIEQLRGLFEKYSLESFELL
ncbi:MAG: hypothetical protein KC777_28730 [Cyanobacteria bacterium HKST-UBA02]|nr:hypothetical protein [Cyanobacteria bacterium HKST-UBA02]